VPGRNARPTISIIGDKSAGHSTGSATPAGAVIASFNLASNPDLAGHSVYFAFEAAVSPKGSALALMIDPGGASHGRVCHT
jgi:hypothetical protein